MGCLSWRNMLFIIPLFAMFMFESKHEHTSFRVGSRSSREMSSGDVERRKKR